MSVKHDSIFLSEDVVNGKPKDAETQLREFKTNLSNRNVEAIQQEFLELHKTLATMTEQIRSRDNVIANIHQEVQDLKRQFIMMSVANRGTGPTA